MKLIDGFVLRNVGGQSIITGEGLKQINFNKLIGLNPVAAYLWKEIEGKEFTDETLTTLLTTRYDVDEKTARKDSIEIIKNWLKAGLIEE